MTDETLTLVGFITLPIAGMGVITAITTMIWQFYTKYRDRKMELLKTHELAIVENTLHTALIEVELEVHGPEPVHNYRHNIHCPICGRFSKRVMGMDDVVECKVHGIKVRWKDIPVDWAVVPVALGTSIEVSHASISPLVDLVPITQPIPIIVPDDLSDIYALGAAI